MNTQGERRESYITDRERERTISKVRERTKKEKERRKKPPTVGALPPHTSAYTRIRDLSRSRPPLI